MAATPFDDQQRQARFTQRGPKEDMMAGARDRVVTAVATYLMPATIRRADAVSERVLAHLVEH